MKKITSLILALGMILAMYAIPTFAAPDSNACIKVTATYEKYTGGISFAGYNINGYDAYNYKFVAGDKFEYEVYLETNAPGIGYIDIQGSKLKSVDADGVEVHDWKFLRETDAVDSEGIACHPVNDLTAVAFQKWYKRSTTIPKSFEGFMTRHIFPMVQKVQTTTPVLPTTPEVFYIRNVNVVGADGKVKLVIFGDNERFISSTKVEAQGAKLVLVGENQKTATTSTSTTVSKASTAASTTTSTAGSTSVVSTSKASGDSISNETSKENSIDNEDDSTTSDENSKSSSNDEKGSNSNVVIIILAAVIVLLIAGGITGFLIMKKKMVK